MSRPASAAAESAPSPAIRAQLLGAPELRCSERRFALSRQRNRLLFYLLAARPGPVGRDTLYGLLWPEADEHQAHRALSQALTQIRADLPEPTALRHNRESVWLDRTVVWSDVAALDGLAIGAPAARSTADLETVVTLYRGRFLEGVSCAGQIDLEDWMLAEADRMERIVLESLAELCRRHARADRLREATATAQRYLRFDPCDERMHRRLLSLFAATDNRNAAIAHYRRCVDVLHRELGVAPEAATRAAYERATGHRVAVPSIV